MKTLVHRTSLTSALEVDLARVKSYLRVDFDEDNIDINFAAKTAAQELEHYAQIALLNQTIRVTIFNPPSGSYGVGLPIGPVADETVPTVTIDGNEFTDFELTSGLRAHIRWLAPYHELTPTRLQIEYTAGFGTTAQSIPPDLRQAVLDQTALLYDARSPMSSKSLTTSPHLARIGAKYRGVRCD
ncbi:hypothetical protein [uncultured Ruegeria sp.]|uniref:head-tail connector protein n=1 Tax=uncultured Ruegeria sp. TaxID=259304 RepID=UPI0026177C18|nr:hypothetical protein [uncultured Ruegeria sp.]